MSTLLVALALVTLGLALIYSLLFRRSYTGNLPPEPWHEFYIGTMVRFALDPVQFLTSRLRLNNDIFTLNLAGRRLVLTRTSAAFNFLRGYHDDILSAKAAMNDFGFVDVLGELNIHHGTAIHRRLLLTKVNPELDSYCDDFAEMVAASVPKYIPEGKVDIFESFRKIGFDFAIRLFIHPRVPEALPTFIDEFHNWQENQEEVVSKVVVARKPLQRLALNSSARVRSNLRNKLAQFLESEINSGVPLPPYASLVYDAVVQEGLVQDRVANIGVNTASIPAATAQIVADVLLGLLFAAHKNISIGSAQALVFLKQRPDLEAQVRAEISSVRSAIELSRLSGHGTRATLNAVVNETLRVTSHSIGAIRKVVPSEGFTVKMKDGRNFTIPKGYYFAFPFAALSRDERVWTNEEAWEPERLLEPRCEGSGVTCASTPFSGGIHVCPGMQFVQRAMPILVATVLRRYEYDIVGTVSPLTFVKATLAQRTQPVIIDFTLVKTKH